MGQRTLLIAGVAALVASARVGVAGVAIARPRGFGGGSGDIGMDRAVWYHSWHGTLVQARDLGA